MYKIVAMQTKFDIGGETRAWLTDFAGVMRFFSRIPLPPLAEGDDPVAIPDFSRAARVLPLVGVAVTLPAAALLIVLSLTGLPPVVIAALCIALTVAVTGAFHEDGLADTADGFGGGQTVERKLEIMRDSRLGTFGAVTLVLSILIRVGALAGLIGIAGGTKAAVLLLVTAAVSRALICWFWRALPPARLDGKSAAAGRPELGAATTASAIALALFLAGAALTGIASSVVALLVAAGAVAGLAWLSKRQIGGQTGDVLGAAQQAGEVAFLIGLLI